MPDSRIYVYHRIFDDRHNLMLPDDLQTCEDLNIFAVSCKSDNCFLCLGCLSDSHSASSCLSVTIHCVDRSDLCAVKHLFNSFLDLVLCSIRINKECVFLIA